VQRQIGLSALFVIACMGCGDGDGTDAGTVDAMADAGSLVTPPDIPWLADGAPPVELPTLTPCPAEWREVADGDVPTCDPYPGVGPETCGAGEVHFPGEAGCAPVGDPCPPGPFATTLPSAGTIVYVDAAAAPGGDGTLASPYASLASVPWISLASGDTVALGKGTYEGSLPLDAGVSVIGACAGETILTGVAGPIQAVITVTSSGEPASIRNVTVADAPQAGVRLSDGRALSLTGVVIERARRFGVLAEDRDTRLTFEDVVVRETLSEGGGFGRGIYLYSGAHLDASRLVLARNHETGMLMSDSGTEAVLVDTVVHETLALESDGSGGSGIDIYEGARLEATRLLVAANHQIGVFAKDVDTEVTLTDVIVRDTSPVRGGMMGRGINVQDGARLEATRALVSGNSEMGVFAAGVGVVVVLDDSIVRGTMAREADGLGGRGINAQEGGRLEASRVLVEQNTEVGVFAVHAGTEVVLADVVVRDTQPRPSDGTAGRGLYAETGARIEASRLWVERNRDVGVFLASEGTEALLTDVVVRDTEPEASGTGGRGISAQAGARLTASRLLVSNSRECGVFTGETGASITLMDTVVRDTRAQESTGAYGYGLMAQDGAEISADRIVVRDVLGAGVSSVIGAIIRLRDASILSVGASMCDCPSSGFGYAAAATGGTLELSRFEIRDAAICGLFVADAPSILAPAPMLDAMSGTVSGSRIGACVQADGYDSSRLSDDVAYVDNETNFDSTSLPVPAVVDSNGLIGP